MRRTSISPEYIYTLAAEYTSLESRPSGRGRPREYGDALILALVGLKELYGFSYRETLEFGRWFWEAPSLATFHYRIACLKPSTLEGFVSYLGRKLAKDLKPEAYAMDGTGFQYHDLYPQEILRGDKVRMIRSHVRAITLAAISGRRRYVLSVSPGKAYASEIRLGRELLERKHLARGSPFLADRAYDGVAFLSTIKKKGCVPVVDIKGKDSMHQKVRHPLRLESLENVEHGGIYKRRTQIESLFGNAKEKLGSQIRVFRTDIAMTFAMMRLALFNISMLARIDGGIWAIFRTGSPSIEPRKSRLQGVGPLQNIDNVTNKG